MADTSLYLGGRSSHPVSKMASIRGGSSSSSGSNHLDAIQPFNQSAVTTPSTATDSDISTPPVTPFSRSQSSHSTSNSKLFAPISPPPTVPLPALPASNLIPFKPKLLPKRGLSRSPSPIVRTEQRQTYETKASRDEFFRSQDQARLHKQQSQKDQYGYAFSDDDESGPAASTRTESKLSIHTSPSDSRQSKSFGDLLPKSQSHSPSSPLSPFQNLDGPLLLSETVRRSGSSSKLRNPERKPFVRTPSNISQDSQRTWQLAGPSNRATEMSHSHSETGRKKSEQKRGMRPKTAPQKQANSTNDVVMRELGSSADEDYDEPIFETVTQPRSYLVDRRGSGVIPMTIEEAEPAWADDASIIDVDEKQYSQTEVAPEEIFEVAALRRQVEQLQMALKKQMAAPKERIMKPASISNTFINDQYPFGMPTPEPSSRDGSSVGVGGLKASPSSSRSFREQHLAPPYISEQVSPSMGSSSTDRRFKSNYRSSQKQSSNDYYSSSNLESSPRHRLRSDTQSSIFADESASSFVREEDVKLEELSRKIQALEAMFKTSSLSSPSSNAGSSRTQMQVHNPIDTGSRIHQARRSSEATVSTVEGGSSFGRRSPAASAYNFNATSPHDEDQHSTFKPSLMSRDSNGSSSSIDASSRKGVARFIMGVGTSKGNVPRDEHGNPLPLMQVSWSRKRNQKIAKPSTGAKMTVGPGRGRIVMHAKPTA